MRRRATVIASLASLAMTAVGCTTAGGGAAAVTGTAGAGTHSPPATDVNTRRVRVSVAGGCPAALGAADDVVPATGLTDGMLPRATVPRGGLVCAYRPTARGTAIRLTHTVVSLRSARALAAAVANVSLKPLTRTYACPSGRPGDVAVIALDYAAGPVDLWYARLGCPTLDNGQVLAFGVDSDSFTDFVRVLTSVTS